MTTTAESIPDKLDASQEVGIIELKVVAGERGEQQAVDPIHGLPTSLGPEYAFATGGHAIAYGKERPCIPRTDYTYAIKYKNPDERRSMIKFKFRYRPMMWLLKYSIVTLNPPSPQKNSGSGSGRTASPAVPGQGLLINSIPKIESSPSPQGVMLVPSRSKKSSSSHSKKGKEVYSPSLNSTGDNPLSIVSLEPILLCPLMTKYQSQLDMQRKYYGASGQFSEHELPQPPQYGQPVSGYPSSVIDTTRFMGSPSLSSDGSGPSGSDFSYAGTPQHQSWDVSIDAPMSNEPAQWMNLVQFSSMYPGQQNYSQAGYGKY